MLTTARAETLTVGDCVRRALEHSASVGAATFETRAASSEADAAHAAYFPKLTAHSEYGRSEGFDEAVTNGGSTAAVMRIEATLLDGGVRSATFEAAKAKLRQAEAIARQAKADLVFAVRSAYYTALGKDSEVRIEGEAVNALTDYSAWLDRQQERGLTPPGDVERAMLARISAETNARSAAADRTIAEETLTSLTGTAVSVSAMISPDTEPVVPGEARSVDESPVVADAIAQLETAEHEAEAARGERFGAVRLGAEGGALGVRPETTFAEDRGGQFLLQFDLPVVDAAMSYRETTARLRAVAARAKVEEARRTVSLALANADAVIRRADADLATARDAEPVARRQFELVRARHAGGGNVRLLEVLDALNQSVEARLNVSRAVLARRLALTIRAQTLGDTEP
jgi:cobalt-zinc-cadmium efflux system outer membrane protein